MKNNGIKVAGVILAGGLSRRMNGNDKSLLAVGGKSMLTHVIERMAGQVDQLAINANGDPDRFTEHDLDIIPDVISGHAGPLAGIHAGMKWANGQSQVSHIVTAAADTPFLPTNLVETLANRITDSASDEIVFASTFGRLHPVFGLWPIRLFSSLQSFLQDTDIRKVVAFADLHTRLEAQFDINSDDLDPFFNINTPEELEFANKQASALNQ